MSRAGRAFLSSAMAVAVAWAATTAISSRVPRQSPAEVTQAYNRLARVRLQAAQLDAQARANAAEVEKLRATIAQLKNSIAALGTGNGG